MNELMKYTNKNITRYLLYMENTLFYRKLQYVLLLLFYIPISDDRKNYVEHEFVLVVHFEHNVSASPCSTSFIIYPMLFLIVKLIQEIKPTFMYFIVITDDNRDLVKYNREWYRYFNVPTAIVYYLFTQTYFVHLNTKRQLNN